MKYHEPPHKIVRIGNITIYSDLSREKNYSNRKNYNDGSHSRNCIATLGTCSFKNISTLEEDYILKLAKQFSYFMSPMNPWVFKKGVHYFF